MNSISLPDFSEDQQQVYQDSRSKFNFMDVIRERQTFDILETISIGVLLEAHEFGYCLIVDPDRKRAEIFREYV